MERPGASLLRPLRPTLALLLLLLAMAPAVAGQTLAEDPDPIGDVTSQAGVPANEPTADMVNIVAEAIGDELILHNEVSAALPIAGSAEPNSTRLYTFLFVIDFDSTGEKPLVQSADAVFVCTFHQGIDDLTCQQSLGERILRGYGIVDRNATLRLALEANDTVQRMRVGGAVTLADENAKALLAQDWTPTTIQAQDFEDSGPAVDGTAQAKPWYKTTRGAILILGVVAYVSYLAYERWKKNNAADKKAEAPAKAAAPVDPTTGSSDEEE